MSLPEKSAPRLEIAKAIRDLSESRPRIIEVLCDGTVRLLTWPKKMTDATISRNLGKLYTADTSAALIMRECIQAIHDSGETLDQVKHTDGGNLLIYIKQSSILDDIQHEIRKAGLVVTNTQTTDEGAGKAQIIFAGGREVVALSSREDLTKFFRANEASHFVKIAVSLDGALRLQIQKEGSDTAVHTVARSPTNMFEAPTPAHEVVETCVGAVMDAGLTLQEVILMSGGDIHIWLDRKCEEDLVRESLEKFGFVVSEVEKEKEDGEEKTAFVVSSRSTTSSDQGDSFRDRKSPDFEDSGWESTADSKDADWDAPPPSNDDGEEATTTSSDDGWNVTPAADSDSWDT